VSVNDDRGTTLDGFTITGGHSAFIQTDPSPSTAITVEGTLISHYYYGAGIYNSGSSATFKNLVFVRNECQNTGGAGLYNELAAPLIVNCSFVQNNTYGNAGSSCEGGGIYNMASSPVIMNTSFTENMSWYGGGAFSTISNAYYYPNNLSNVTITNCTFTGNTAGNGFGVDESSGGALELIHSTVTVTNSLFAGNQAGTGGGITTRDYEDFGYIGSLVITNSTLYGNKGKRGTGVGAILNGMGPLGTFQVNNSAVYGNISPAGEGGVLVNGGGSVVYQNSLVQNNSLTGNGNIPGNVDPLFNDVTNNDFSLQATSPLIDKGNNSLYPVLGQDSYSGADLSGNSRLAGTSIDIGAYEYPAAAVAPTDSLGLPAVQLAVTGDTVLINWNAVSSGNSASFIVQHSSDSLVFADIKSVQGSTSPGVLKNFTSSDVNPDSVNFYRIKMILANPADTLLSKIVRIDRTKNPPVVTPEDSIGQLQLSLAPSGDTVRINWTAIASVSNVVYEVQHSIDSIHFFSRKTVNSAGTPGTLVAYQSFDVSPGAGTHYYRIRAIIPGSTDSLFSKIGRINIARPSFTLSSFTATVVGRTTVLEWKTSSELDNSRFDVEVSTNGTDFNKIGSLPAHGTGAPGVAYNFIDPAPQVGTNYYRIARVETNGNKQYSEIRMIEIPEVQQSSLRVFPNPVTGTMHVVLHEAAVNDRLLRLFDSGGHVVLLQHLAAGTTTVDIDISRLFPGIYILRYGKEEFKVLKR
ncbi:MAG: T9SS type A sorting domain-containing protein, partial [Chitinophagaceae bacterium]